MEEKELYKLKTDYSTHPSETLKEYVEFEGLNFEKLADKKHLDLFIVKKIIEEKLEVTEDIAKKLTKLIPNIPYTFWLNMQKHYNEQYKKNDLF